MKIRTPWNVIGDAAKAIVVGFLTTHKIIDKKEEPKANATGDTWDHLAVCRLRCLRGGDQEIGVCWDEGDKYATGYCPTCNYAYTIEVKRILNIGEVHEYALGHGHLLFTPKS